MYMCVYTYVFVPVCVFLCVSAACISRKVFTHWGSTGVTNALHYTQFYTGQGI